MKSRFLAGPYIAWMAIFTVVPLGMVVYFAFTDNSGAFTFANLTYAWEYWPVLLRSVWYAVAACLICLVVGLPRGVCDSAVHRQRAAPCCTCW